MVNMNEEIKNNMIPEEIKEICLSCEANIHCQGKGCAFRSLGNEYCDYVLNATRKYLDLQQKVEQLENKIKYAQKIEQEYSALLTENTELENIRKEAIEYVENNCLYEEEYDYDEEDNLLWKGAYDYKAQEDLLNILNKGSESNVKDKR